MAARNSFARRLYTGDLSYDFMKNRKIWYSFTAVLLLIAALAVVFSGIKWGIEFSGGTEFGAPVTVTEKTVEEFRHAVLETGAPQMQDLQVTTVTAEVRIQTRPLDVEAGEVTLIRKAIAAQAGIESEQVTYQTVGGSWGQQITERGIIALVVFLALVMILITIYFRDWKMAVSAIIALMHDLGITIGIYALVGFSFTPTTLIGLLTILGYSLYDTVVVFDKVRENVTDLFSTSETFSTQANKAINQVLIRSINTTVVAALPVAALTFGGAVVLGTGPLKDLGLVLLVGMIAGAYSSIFIATPLLAQLRELEPAMKEHRQRLERRANKNAWKDGKNQVVGSLADPVIEVTEVETEAALVPATVLGTSTVRKQPKKTTRSGRKQS